MRKNKHAGEQTIYNYGIDSINIKGHMLVEFMEMNRLRIMNISSGRAITGSAPVEALAGKQEVK